MHPFFARAKALGRSMILGHRGAKALTTENTMTAFDLARQHGADGVELDVQLSADGHVVVFHDKDLARLAGRGERPTDLDLAALQRLRLGRDERIPTLAQVLGEFATGEFVLNIEIKSPGFGRGGRLIDAVLDLLTVHRQRRRGGRGRLEEEIVISSFDPFAIGQVRRRAPELATGYLFSDFQPTIFRHAWQAPNMRPHALHPEHVILTGQPVTRWRQRGFFIGTWTVDDEADLLRVAALDPYCIISDDPGRARRVLA